MNNSVIIDRKSLLRDFMIVNIAGGLGALIMFVGILMQFGGVLPKLPCAFYNATHMYCPGCGGSRALISMLNGRLIPSLVYNPAVLFGLVVIIYYEVGAIIAIIRNDGRYLFYKKLWPVYTYLVIVLLFTVLRDILYVGFGIDLIDLAGGL